MGENIKQHYPRCPEQDLELWKHHASFGGEDKNRMVIITTWLLSFSAAIFWYIVTNLPPRDSDDFLRMIFIFILGMLISILGVYISLLLGGYANQNWEKADEIANSRHWRDLLPDHSTTLTHRINSTKRVSRWKRFKERIGWLTKASNKKRIKWLAGIGRKFARPCDTSELAPVFLTFLGFSAASFLVHFIALAAFVISLVAFVVSPTESPVSEVF